jgi:hypothetical protein
MAAVSMAAACAAPTPEVSVATDRIARHRPLEIRGEGFTPGANVSSHLRRSDGSEFPVLPILTDSEGAFTHTIDTVILELGTHEWWVVDDTTGRTSNTVRFDVTFDYSRAGVSRACAAHACLDGAPRVTSQGRLTPGSG